MSDASAVCTIRPANLRMLWVLRYLLKNNGHCIAWDEEVVDDFIKLFPESAKTTVRYMIGSDSCPMLNRAAGRAKRLGFLRAGHIGTENARSYNQRTWARIWHLTDAGKDYVLFVDAQKVEACQTRKRDPVGHLCATRNCQWELGVTGCCKPTPRQEGTER